eukprot:4684515-Alexandrium_andersonii.AAC.1
MSVSSAAAPTARPSARSPPPGRAPTRAGGGARAGASDVRRQSPLGHLSPLRLNTRNPLSGPRLQASVSPSVSTCSQVRPRDRTGSRAFFWK